MNDSGFAARLKALRIAAGKKVPETSTYLRSLGHKASEKTIYGWERGHSQPTPDVFLDLCKFYDIKDILLAFGYKFASSDLPANGLEPDEQQLINDYRSLNSQGQSLVRQNMELIVLSDKYKKYYDLPDMEKEA